MLVDAEDPPERRDPGAVGVGRPSRRRCSGRIERNFSKLERHPVPTGALVPEEDRAAHPPPDRDGRGGEHGTGDGQRRGGEHDVEQCDERDRVRFDPVRCRDRAARPATIANSSASADSMCHCSRRTPTSAGRCHAAWLNCGPMSPAGCGRSRCCGAIPRPTSRRAGPVSACGDDFATVRAYVMFVGQPRTGHSLVGALLDAHPNALVAHELDALKYVAAGYDRRRLYALLVEQERARVAARSCVLVGVRLRRRRPVAGQLRPARGDRRQEGRPLDAPAARRHRAARPAAAGRSGSGCTSSTSCATRTT